MKINITDYKNPSFVDASMRLIDLEINTKEYGWIPTTIDLLDNDTSEHIKEIKQWLQANAGSIQPYVAPVATLDDVLEDKTLYIVGTRDSLLKADDATVTTPDGLVWQVDPTSVSQLNDALTIFSVLGATPEGFTWRDANNINHPADLALLASIAGARAAQVQAIWKRSWELKDQLKTAYEAQDIPTMEALTW